MPFDLSFLNEAGLIACGLGGLVGLVLGLSGAGGGVIAVPLLVFGLNLPMQAAAPVGLIAVGLAAGIGAALGLREGIVRYRAAALIGLFGMLVAPLGVWLAQRLPNAPLLLGFILGPMMEEYLRRALLLSRGDWSVFVTRPLSAGLLSAALLLLVFVLMPSIKAKRDEAFVGD